MKRRSGTIGISPRMVGKQKPAAAPAAAARPAAGAAPAAAKPAAKPVAAIGKNMSDDKRARLEAIRAANAAKPGAAASAPAATVDVDEMAPDDGVAVEAAPTAAAARPASGGIPFNAGDLLGGVPANTAMAEDKVERLKAIRTGNLAKRG
jgi:hypothetical protein